MNNHEALADSGLMRLYALHCGGTSYPPEEELSMLTETDIKAAIARHCDASRFHYLCFQHPDVVMRAKYQAVFLKLGAGMKGSLDPTEAEVRATPAGQTIPADQKFTTTPRRRGCGSGGCAPRRAGA
jgi:hypothetical protein